ncbi:hypothetical protein OUZ56_016012 [Daphnia magna]|uniref:Uncharacterized protein n=1 Tax=Daphnia magna TaxID=35525 RepID=A0ABR0APD9_9CRUS|nr:hypothetical protein OUZ56_016012 [Daphnia magna]
MPVVVCGLEISRKTTVAPEKSVATVCGRSNCCAIVDAIILNYIGGNRKPLIINVINDMVI